MSMEVTEIAAIVSEEICNIYPSLTRVARLLNLNDGIAIEMTTSTAPDGLEVVDGFWPENCPLSADRKRELFWQYHRSMGCNEYTAVLATVLKGLCDSGVRLAHYGMTVVDILVLNTVQFDVSDIISAKDRVLSVHDPVTDKSIPIIATHETMERAHKMGKDVCCRLGIQLPKKESKWWSYLRKHSPDSYKGTCPHWWMAVVVEGPGIGHTAKTYTMVHLDVCGAAYDPSSLVMSPRSKSLVSLKVFNTPEYEMIPSNEEGRGHKLVMRPTLSGRASGGKDIISLQPKSNRYFHCYHTERSSIEVTPLVTFLERKPIQKQMNAKITELVQSIQSDQVNNLATGSKVVVCNIKSKPELNGRSGVVVRATGRDHVSSDRLPVLVDGSAKPISLKPSCIQLPPQKLQYRTLEELQRLIAVPPGEEERNKAQIDSMTEKEKSKARKSLDDPDVEKVIQACYSGQTGFTRYGDPEFKRGVKKILTPPCILPPSVIDSFRKGYALSNHPKAGDAIMIINLYKATKQRMMTEHPECVLPNGAVAMLPGSELMRVQTSIQNRIRGDPELKDIFQKLDEAGLFANPVK